MLYYNYFPFQVPQLICLNLYLLLCYCLKIPRHLQECVCSKAVLVAKRHKMLSTGNGLGLNKGENPCPIA